MALSGAMDVAALTELKSRAIAAIISAKKYRGLAERRPALRDFYRALAFTHERMGREANLLIDKAKALSAVASEVA
jgi:hypothetical protein